MAPSVGLREASRDRKPGGSAAAGRGKGEPGCAGGLNRDRKIASLKCPSPFP